MLLTIILTANIVVLVASIVVHFQLRRSRKELEKQSEILEKQMIWTDALMAGADVSRTPKTPPDQGCQENCGCGETE